MPSETAPNDVPGDLLGVLGIGARRGGRGDAIGAVAGAGEEAGANDGVRARHGGRHDALGAVGDAGDDPGAIDGARARHEGRGNAIRAVGGAGDAAGANDVAYGGVDAPVRDDAAASILQMLRRGGGSPFARPRGTRGAPAPSSARTTGGGSTARRRTSAPP